MLTLDQVRGYIKSMKIAERVYIGKLDNKQQHSIGVYPREEKGLPVIPLGGVSHSSYETKRISLLIHWDKDISITEQAAQLLYKKLMNESSLTIEDVQIFYLVLQVPEPVYVGTDDNGVHEYVIWLDFVYERK